MNHCNQLKTNLTKVGFTVFFFFLQLTFKNIINVKYSNFRNEL